MKYRLLLLCLIFVLMLNIISGGIIPQGSDKINFTYSSLSDWIEPRIDCDAAGKLYAVWLDNGTSMDKNDVYFSMSSDSGQTWSAKTMVNNPDNNFLELSSLDISVSSDGKIYVVWFDPSSTPGRVYFAMSANQGSTWTRYVLWQSLGTLGLFCDIDVDPVTGAIFVGVSKPGEGAEDLYNVYCLYNINQGDINSWYYQTNGLNDTKGKAWGGSDYDGPHVKVSAYNNKVFVVWEDFRDGKIYLYCDYAVIGTTTFGTDRRVCTAITQNQTDPELEITTDGSSYISFISNNYPYILRGSNATPPVFQNPVNIFNPASNNILKYTMALTPANQPVLAFCIGIYVYSAPDTKTMVFSTINNGASFISNDMTARDDIDEIDIAVINTSSTDYLYGLYSVPVNDDIMGRKAILDETMPSTPQGLSAQGRDTCADISWDASSDANGIDYYKIYRKKAGESEYKYIAGTTQRTYRDAGLDPVEYQYKASAVDKSGIEGNMSSSNSATPTQGTDLPASGLIVFEKNNAVYKMNSNTTGQQKIIDNGLSPNFYRDGTKIIYSSGQSIYSAGTDGSNPSVIFQDANLSARGFDCDGSPYTFSYIKMLHHSLVCAGDPVWTDIYDSYPAYFKNASAEYTPSQYYFTEDTAVSSNTDYVLYIAVGFHQVCFEAKNYDAKVMFILNKSNDKIASYGGLIGILSGDFTAADFSPSGSDVVFAWKYGDVTNIWKASIDPATMNLANFLRLTDNAANVTCTNPQYSSDGSRIIFEKGSPASLCIVNQDGSGYRALNVEGTHPTWYLQQTVVSEGNYWELY